MKTKYNVKVVHLFSKEDEVERKSSKSISKLEKLGIEYVSHMNFPYNNEPPKETCIRPQDIRPEPGGNSLTGRHYGCYLAFRNAIEKEFTEDLDFFMICERDAYIEVPFEKFGGIFNQCCKFINENKVDYFSFGDRRSLITGELLSQILEPANDIACVTDKFYLCHMIMFPKSIRTELLEILQTEKWDVADLFFLRVFSQRNKRFGITKNRIATQLDGESLINRRIILNSSADSPGKQLLSLYEKVPLTIRSVQKISDQDSISVSFIYNPKVEIKGTSSKDYVVEFFDPIENKAIFGDKIKPNFWTMCNRQWFTPWEIRVNGNVIHKYNATNQNVLISFESSALGDTIAWVPYVEEFRKIHNCNIYVSTFWNELFKDEYPELNFVKPGTVVHNLYASYVIGCFDDDTSNYKNKRCWRESTLQKIASDSLGMPYEEIRTKIHIPNLPRPIEDKYVCISERATQWAKMWLYPNGWQELVDWLNSVGYKVMVISKEKTALKNIIDKTGQPILHTANNLYHSEFYIGLPHGPSWLAWGLNKPVVMIGGYSINCEFVSGNTRVLPPEGSCTSCFHDTTLLFNRSLEACVWYKDYECNKKITTQMIIDAIKKANLIS
jgi:autotransporter strand-loop-strand O-heptosyltransferase